MYRAGTTSRTDTHLYKMMATIAKQLTDEEIGGLSSYLQGLHPAADDLGVDSTAVVAAAPAAPAPAPAAAVVEPATDAAPMPGTEAEAPATSTPETPGT